MIWIRPWSLEDAQDIALALDNQKIHDNLRDGLPLPYTVSDAVAYIQSVLEAPPESQYAWAIQWEGRAIGSIGLFRKDNIHRQTAELGYYIGEAYWGQGIVTRAVVEACAWVFTHTNLLRIFAEPFACNPASCRVLEKAGFLFEGTLRDNAVKNGRVLDMELYALLRP